MTLSLVVLSNGSGNLRRLLEWADSKPYIDQVYGFVDDKSDSIVPYEFFRAGVPYERVKVKTIDAALAYCHSPERIKTDWALHLGDDELMGQWFDESVERLMASPYDVYSFPRYNLMYKYAEQDALWHISSEPWYPDWCQRLFRPGHLIHNGKLHEGPEVDGRLAMARPHVFHFDFLDQSYEERQAKWRKYQTQGVEQVSQERGLPADYYKRWCLPEEFDHTVQVCEEPL